MLPPGWEEMSPEEKARFQRLSPGSLVASEVQDAMNGTSPPLTEGDISATSVVVGQVTQAAVGVPAFAWQQELRRLLLSTPPWLVRSVAIIGGLFLPVAVFANARAIWTKVLAACARLWGATCS